jgi:hypothetical protein
MKPFLLNELFDVNPEMDIQNANVPGVPAVVVDNFLKHPAEARAVVGSAPAANWKIQEGGRNFVDYYDCRLRFPVLFPNNMIDAAQLAIRTVYATETRPQDASVDINWFMQIKEKRCDFAFPHHDITAPVRASFTCIVYLNSAEECSGGTAMFRFRKSNSLLRDGVFDQATQQHPRIVESGKDYWLDKPEEFWEQVGVIDMVPGRLLIFPSQYFHAAFHPVNSYYEFPRLTLAFWMIC